MTMMTLGVPGGHRRAPRRAMLAVCLLAPPPLWMADALAQSARQEPEPFVEHVTVTRLLVDARVFDEGGRPIPDLDASSFTVRIDGRATPVESAEWVGLSPGPAVLEPGRTPASGRPDAAGAPPGRLFVFLVQKDLEPSRIIGLMEVAQLAETLLLPLRSHDRVAVLSFDSRLRIWTDFTNDLERVRAILSNDVLLKHPGPVSASRGVSLAARLDERVARRTADIEHALLRIGEALAPLPGAKSLVLLGYGFGRLQSSLADSTSAFNPALARVVQMSAYHRASDALQRARVAVFSVNVTQAHYNSLQQGLQRIAADTGGFYASAFEFPRFAVQMVSNALAGHYVLFVEKPDLPEGPHQVEVKLTRRKGTVIARRTFIESR